MVKTVNVSTKGFAKKSFKLVQSEKLQITEFLNYQRSLLSSLGCPVQAIKSYISTLGTRICSERAGFLKLHRGLFIQGLKILGNDQTSFQGWKMKGIFPRLYHWVFTEISAISQQWNGSPLQVSRVRGLLSVLYGARCLKLAHGRSALNKALSDFRSRVELVALPVGEMDDYRFILEKLEFRFKLINQGNSFPNGANFDLSRRTQKPNKLWKTREHLMPQCVFDAHCLAQDWNSNAGFNTPLTPPSAFVDGGPIGIVNILTERAGKTRVICGYNGYVNSSDLYDRCRSYLDTTKEDCSRDQTLGHSHAQLLSGVGRYYPEKVIRVPKPLSTKVPRNQSESKRTLSLRHLFSRPVEKPADVDYMEIPLGSKILSADLSAFTDNISKGTYTGALQFLKCMNLMGPMFSSEVALPSGETITPKAALMGFKGCFDVASMIHHAVLPVEANYRVCGDDFVGVIPPELYESLVGRVGLELNRSKTLWSSDTAVFCGKCYKTGLDITPFVPALYNITSSKTTESVESARSALDNGYLFPAQFRELCRIVKTRSLSLLKGVKVSFELPSKLGGFCTRTGPSRSLLTLLHERYAVIIASRHVKYLSDRQEIRSRNSFPGFPSSGVRVLPWMQLYFQGGQSLPKKVKQSQQKIGGKLLGLDVILEYYYGLIPGVQV
jgi:hypothetical protein